MKKKEILPFVTTWGDLEGIVPSEISQKHTYCMVSHVESENAEVTGAGLVVPGQGLGWRNRWTWSEGTAFTCKIHHRGKNTSHRCGACPPYLGGSGSPRAATR